jgi:hypothetical protein
MTLVELLGTEDLYLSTGINETALRRLASLEGAGGVVKRLCLVDGRLTPAHLYSEKRVPGCTVMYYVLCAHLLG